MTSIFAGEMKKTCSSEKTRFVVSCTSRCAHIQPTRVAGFTEHDVDLFIVGV